MFQFLIGIINPLLSTVSLSRISPVSIPYRYYKSLVHLLVCYGSIWFQFLIGIINLFQTSFSPYIQDKFQFLIGIINLGDCTSKSNLIIQVSIPYRYYKSIYSDGMGLTVIMFQFLIGIINLRILTTLSSCHYGFNSLQVL